jgi:CBS domain-containing protein
MRVETIMTTDVLAVPPEMPLKEAGRLMLEHEISGLPVVGEDGVLLGVVSQSDIVAKEREVLPGDRPPWLLSGGRQARTLRRKADAFFVRDAMTSPAISVPPYRSVAAVARVMLDAGVNRLPVVQNRRLVGIVTRSDMVRAFVREDGPVGAEVRAQIDAYAAPEIDVSRIDVTIHDGDVILGGDVPSSTTAETVARIARNVPGVTSVSSDLTWAKDDS